MEDWRTQTLEALETGPTLELSLVELVVMASECSEDGSEISDLVDGLIDSGRVAVRVAA
jgi:hypothetical protein